MQRSTRLTTALLALVLGVTTACSSTAEPDRTAANPSPSTTATYEPIRTAKAGDVPPAGSYQVLDTAGVVITVAITHTPVVLGEPFTEYVDFTHLGTWAMCQNDPHAAENVRRPCDQAFRQDPLAAQPVTLNGPESRAWRPVEGKDPLKVVCQVVADPNSTTGVQQDARGAKTRSNVWNRIEDPRIKPGGVGHINDVWMGGVGFRGKRC